LLKTLYALVFESYPSKKPSTVLGANLDFLPLLTRGGHSGYPKNSGRVIWVFLISGFKNCYPKYTRNKRVPENSGI
jgi:hypothetical protein